MSAPAPQNDGPDHAPGNSGAPLFPATHWSLVARAGDADTQVRREALVELLRDYLPALRSFLQVTRRVPPGEVDDLLQGFLADKVIEEGLMPRADPSKGRFRTFLLAALNHYLINQTVHDNRQKRRHPSGPDVSLDSGGSDPHDTFAGAACGAAVDPQSLPDPHAVDPAALFDAAWARQVVRQAVERTEAECRRSGRPDVWSVLEARVLRPRLEGAEPVPCHQLVGRFGIASPEAVSNLLTTAKRMFARNLRAVIGGYEPDPAAVEAEIADLRAILARGRGLYS